MSNTLKFLAIFFGIPLALLITGFFLSSVQFYHQNISLLSLTKNHSIGELTKYKSDNLLAEDKIAGEFVAMDDFLGIVGVRFNTYWRINDDNLLFRIREKGSPTWYYENKYKVDQFQNYEIFPFGFPVIQDSKGKIYDFEIESTAGTIDNSVGLDLVNPVFISIYKYPKELVLSGLGPVKMLLPEKFVGSKDDHIAKETNAYPKQDILKGLGSVGRFLPEKLVSLKNENIGKIIHFAYAKTINILFNAQVPVLSLFSFLPFISYLYWLIVYRHFKHKKYFILICPLLLIFIESLFLIESIDFAVVEIIIIWIWALKYYQLDYMINFQLAILFLILTPVFLWLNNPITSEKFGAWSFLFLTIGMFHFLIGQKFKLHYKYDFLTLLKKIPADFRDV